MRVTCKQCGQPIGNSQCMKWCSAWVRNDQLVEAEKEYERFKEEIKKNENRT